MTIHLFIIDFWFDFFVMYRNKKFSKGKKNVLVAIPKAEAPRRMNLIYPELSPYPSKTSNILRSSMGDRIRIDRTPDVICIASSDDEDCLILSDAENSSKTTLPSDDANRTAKRTKPLKSPASTSSARSSAASCDVVCISSSDEEDCFILSDGETPPSNEIGARVSTALSNNKTPETFSWNRPTLSVSQRRMRKMRMKMWSQRRKIRHSISNL